MHLSIFTEDSIAHIPVNNFDSVQSSIFDDSVLNISIPVPYRCEVWISKPDTTAFAFSMVIVAPTGFVMIGFYEPYFVIRISLLILGDSLYVSYFTSIVSAGLAVSLYNRLE
ncbi:MAG TPA: hypothetical protein ENG70_02340 [Candidatus Cloacimonetes bacterium]|nr:hypothetical protein [Candidatus Cloacimonadota bacterium]HEX37685.1 hypothetical protein [Candidatus Cloacimonadota bacterium]